MADITVANLDPGLCVFKVSEFADANEEAYVRTRIPEGRKRIGIAFSGGMCCYLSLAFFACFLFCHSQYYLFVCFYCISCLHSLISTAI
jgi:hypothetical protein